MILVAGAITCSATARSSPLVSAAAIDRRRLGRQRRRAVGGVGPGAAGAADRRDARRTERTRRCSVAALIPAFNEAATIAGGRQAASRRSVGARDRRGRRVDAMRPRSGRARPAPRWSRTPPTAARGRRCAPGSPGCWPAVHARAAARRRHAAPARRRRRGCLPRPRATGADVVSANGSSSRAGCRHRGITPTGSAAARFRGSSACRSRTPSAAFASSASTRCATLPLTATRLRDRDRDAGQGPPARRPDRGVPITAVYAGQHSKLRPIRDTTRTCFLAVYYRFLERL